MTSTVDTLTAASGFIATSAPTVPANLAAALRVELLGAESLPALAGDWNRLAGSVPFRSWEWLETWWRHYRTADTELILLAVRDDEDRLVGLAPWYLHVSAAHGRVVRFLGDGEVCSEYPTMLAEPGADSRVGAALADWLCGEGKRLWDLIELAGVRPHDSAVEALTARFTAHGHKVHERSVMNCWSVDLPVQLG